MRRAPCSLPLLLALAIGGAPATARAYEATTTHAGLTARAVLGSQLHRYLRGAGLPLGLFTRLELDAGALNRAQLRRVRLQRRKLDPAGGYRYDQRLGQWAVGWLLGGAVLQDVPAVRDRHHFYDPTTRRGLADDEKPLVGSAFALLSMMENGDSLRALLTGTGFNLTGSSGLAWLRSKDNPHSLDRFYAELRASARGETPKARQHALARALLALGGLLHVLQDLASPTHVRNDYAAGHLQRLGASQFNRGSAYERFVATRYGRLGLPDYEGSPIRRRRIMDYFAADDWRGLANLTHRAHFSPGTLPPPRVLPLRPAAGLEQRLGALLRFQRPALGRLDLACAHRRTCYQRSVHGAQLAYRIDRQGTLRFFLDYACHAASARALLPLAVGYSRGLIDHLLRGRISLRREGGRVVVRNDGPPLHDAQLTILSEDARGQRRALAEQRIRGIGRGAPVGLSIAAPVARTVVALLSGHDAEGDHLVAITTSPAAPSTRPGPRLAGPAGPSQPLSATQPSKSSTLPAASQPLTSRPASATRPSASPLTATQPATRPSASPLTATQPATRPSASPLTATQPNASRPRALSTDH